jgi:hypothetical protein
MTDEQLQDAIERGANPPSRDAKAYRTVFQALNRETGFTLPAAFADRVISRLTEKRSSRDIFWLFMGLGSLFLTLIVAILLSGFRPDFSFLSVGAFTFLSSYKGLVVFGILFILLLQWIDRKFVRKSTEVRHG